MKRLPGGKSTEALLGFGSLPYRRGVPNDQAKVKNYEVGENRTLLRSVNGRLLATQLLPQDSPATARTWNLSINNRAELPFSHRGTKLREWESNPPQPSYEPSDSWSLRTSASLPRVAVCLPYVATKRFLSRKGIAQGPRLSLQTCPREEVRIRLGPSVTIPESW